ncbi:hypothetical protein F4861DRAFT_541106 [Xylaria intraflava]|nr:hypothetical protein F4861DRAFT_541106 [Xylaria intraflava]
MPGLSRGELLAAARGFCDSFARKEPIEAILSHFSSPSSSAGEAGAGSGTASTAGDREILVREHGLPQLAPFLGRDFRGLEGAREYFETVGACLDYEDMRFVEFLVDDDACGPESDGGKVAVRGQARFTWIETGLDWDETFVYVLLFDALGKAFDLKYVLVPLFVGASLFGFNATIITMIHNGLAPVLESIGSGAVASLKGAPAPFLRSYTGVASVDRRLCGVVAFFSCLIDGNVPWDVTVFYVWGMAQFAAGWTLLVLEAKRAGNRGRLVSWIGTVGILFQGLTWTFTIPLYLALHLLTSPVAKLKNGDGDGARRALFVYLWDLALLPMAVTLTFVVPTIFMSMPRLFDQTAATHYSWVAVWQPFPAWTILALGFLHYACYYALGSLSPVDEENKPTTNGHGYMVAVRGVYEFMIALCSAAHVPAMALTLMPEAGREFLSHAFPYYAPVFRKLSFAKTFIPQPWYDAPTIDVAAYRSGDPAILAQHFLQYDFYVGTGAMLLWAMYVHQRAVKNPSLVKMLQKTAFWLVIGGPVAAAAVLIWDRDGVTQEGETELKKKMEQGLESSEGRKTK